jgi:hypothetical protein
MNLALSFWAGILPAFFVVTWAAWLAVPAQDGPRDHLFLGGALLEVGSTSETLMGSGERRLTSNPWRPSA